MNPQRHRQRDLLGALRLPDQRVALVALGQGGVERYVNR